ncbi:MAG: ATP-binding protein [Thermoanaerobaculia bacterium]
MPSHSAARARAAAARTAGRPDLAELALLLVPGAALLAGQDWLALAALAAWLVWMLRWSPPLRERWLVAVCGALAALILALAAGRDLQRERAAEPSTERLASAYRAYWEELQASSERALGDLASPPLDTAGQLEAFARLGRLARESRLPGLTLLLLDADRQPVAWGGAGLLHDLGPAGAEGISARSDTPGTTGAAGDASGRRLFLQSAASATAIVLRTLPGRDGSRYQLVCGESRSRRGAPPLLDDLRGEAAGPEVEAAGSAESAVIGSGAEWLWGFGAVAPESTATAVPGSRSILSPGLPPLVLAAGWEDAGNGPRGAGDRAALFVGTGLFGLAALRGFALAVLAGTVLKRPLRIFEVAALALCGVAVLGLGLAVPAAELLLLAGGLALAGLGWFLVWSRNGAPGGAASNALATASLLAAVPGIALLSRFWPAGKLDLGADFALVGAAGAARLGLAAALFGILVLAAQKPVTAATRATPVTPVTPKVAGRLRLAASLGLILFAAAGHDHGFWALLPLVAGTLLAIRSFSPTSGRSASGVAAVLLVAVAISATAWEVGFRQRSFARLSEPLAALLPPDPERKAALAARLESYFDEFDLAEVAPDALPRTGDDDLAFVLWRGSPLARLDAVSALVIERPGMGPSSFAYGLPLTDALDLDLAPARWSGLVPPAWREERVEGRYPLVGGGRAVGEVRFWLVPRPGFGAEATAPGDLAAALLRGGAARTRSGSSGLPGPDPAPVLYSPDGEVLASPWREATPALVQVRAAVAAGERGTRGGATIATPDGRARVLLRERGGAAVALFARQLAPAAALERVGVHAAGALFAAATLIFVGFLLALPRATARDLFARMTRSYANRLILLFSLLLLVPLVLLYALLSRALENRVAREQRFAAEAALSSAQRVLGEYVLTLEPGFGLGTAIDDEILVWLSRVIGHDISLYWGSEVYASSKRELFAAGLLPRRIPGEVWPRMALGGEIEASRTARTGSSEYLELYAPLAVPGLDARQTRLFLSMPLLAQQEEATAETALIRRRTLLATLAVFLLLAALGTRLARAFTRPIMELVGGTQRIAGGAAALGVKSSVLELAALAEAIDRMARRIAEGRDQLLREKRLVEGIIENVTSGVVYLDQAGRVLLANRVARELLEVEPGDRIAERLARSPELAGASRFVSERRDELAQATLRLGGPKGAPGQERDWSLVWVPLAGESEPAALFVVEDISEVLRAQRLEAWAAMAQIIAHEIKNPLTPIRLSTEHMKEVWKRDRAHFESVFDRCTENILRQVEELRTIATEFSTFSRIPKSVRVPGDLAATVREVVEGYRAAPPAGVEIVLEGGGESLPARFDARLVGRALRNLLENAIRVSAGGGRVTIEIERIGDRAEIRVGDRGPGVPPEMLARIFEPYFSTQVGGTGLGLSIALRVAEEHGGSMRARNLAAGGLEVTITMPLL